MTAKVEYDDSIDGQVAYWGLEPVPSTVKDQLDDMRWGAMGNTRFNVYQWDLVRRGFPMDWSVVAENALAGYPNPPTWMLIHALERVLNLRTNSSHPGGTDD